MNYTMVLLGIAVLALIMEIIDSSLGMMYGTLLSPILIGFGFEPLIIVPAILISQAIGGVGGTISHHRFKNANFNGLTMDTKIVLAMVIPGLFAVLLGVFLAISLPKVWVEVYIGILVIVMSILCLSPVNYTFAWWKECGIGILAAFNKALSGGGFGPVASTGGILGGLKSRVSIATTTFAEVCICLGSFIVYMVLSGKLDIQIVSVMCAGALVGGFIGPYISSRISHKRLRGYIGILGIVSGLWVLWSLFA